jgi:DNA-binding MarR family transcriptional regulator
VDQKQFELANRLFFRLYQDSNLLHKIGTRALTDVGATTQQWAVLGALATPSAIGAGLTVKDLIEVLLLSRQNLTAVIDRLVERNWVDRTKDAEDGRSRRICLTPEGKRIWAAMHGNIEAFYAGALVDFDDVERAEFSRLLNKLKSSFSRMNDQD